MNKSIWSNLITFIWDCIKVFHFMIAFRLSAKQPKILLRMCDDLITLLNH